MIAISGRNTFHKITRKKFHPLLSTHVRLCWKRIFVVVVVDVVGVFFVVVVLFLFFWGGVD